MEVSVPLRGVLATRIGFFGFRDWVPVLSGAIIPDAVRN